LVLPWWDLVVDKSIPTFPVQEGTHSTVEDINKQINDKERVAAALENPNLRQTVELCIRDQ
jgi:hypothetical protein